MKTQVCGNGIDGKLDWEKIRLLDGEIDSSLASLETVESIRVLGLLGFPRDGGVHVCRNTTIHPTTPDWMHLEHGFLSPHDHPLNDRNTSRLGEGAVATPPPELRRYGVPPRVLMKQEPSV